jgi:Reverse transcriptase (RNA-dependent DNA polymerase)
MDDNTRWIHQIFQDKHGKTIDQKTHCLKLKKVIYGLLQAARQLGKFKEVVLTLGRSASRGDPCLFTREENNTYSYLIIYVDDGGKFGSKQDIRMVFEALSQHYGVKDLGEMKTFIGYEIVTNRTLCTFISLY